MCRIIYVALAFFFFFGLMRSPSAHGEVNRQISIRAIESPASAILRVYLRVFEQENGLDFPISTLSSSSFKLHTATGELISPKSLATFRTLSPAPKRALVIVFDALEKEKAKTQEQIRQAIANFLFNTRAEYLSIMGFSENKVFEIAELTPTSSENPKALQRMVLDFVIPEQSETSAKNAFCEGMKKFEAWRLRDFTLGDEKVILYISRAPKNQDKEELPCELNRKLASVELYTTLLDKTDASSATIPLFLEPFKGIQKYFERVKFDFGIDPSLSNISAILNEEYAVDWGLFKGISGLASVQVSYHGNILRSKEFILPDIEEPPPEVPLPVNAPVKAEESFSPILLVEIIASLCILALIVSYFIHLRSMVHCSTCLRTVHKGHHDCPFRSTKCIARLVVVSGELSGTCFPVFLGNNVIGKKSGANIRLQLPQLQKTHVIIELFKGKALIKYGFSQKSTDSGKVYVNGWPLSEPRLIGNGNLISFCGIRLRFELKGFAEYT